MSFSQLTFGLILLLSTCLITPTISNIFSVRHLPTPIANSYFRFEFFSEEGIVPSSDPQFFILDPDHHDKFLPFLTDPHLNFPGIFPETQQSHQGAMESHCNMFHPDDVQRLSPTYAGTAIITKASALAFITASWIPANHIVSCIVELLSNPRASATLSLSAGSSLKNPISVPAADRDGYRDPHSFIKLSLHYRAVDAILAGERIDILEFVVEKLPPNVVLPFAIGFDSSSQSVIDRIFFVLKLDALYIADLWSNLKSGTHDSTLTPNNPAFYDQSFEIPSPLCGHDVRIVYSHEKGQWFLVTGDQPSELVICKIPIPIFAIHGMIALSPLWRQDLHLWSGTSIVAYLQLDGRLFKQQSSSNNPQWWFNNNPHVAPYSKLITDSYLNGSLDGSSTEPAMMVFDFTMIFIGTKPTIRFHKFFTHEQYTIQQFFTPVQDENAREKGFLRHFSFVTSPSDIKYPQRYKHLTLNTVEPFSTTYSFDDAFNGYLAVLISFTIPALSFSPFSLQVMTHEGKLLYLSKAANLFISAELTKISDTSSTTVTTISTIFDQSWPFNVPTVSLDTPQTPIPIPNENYYMFPFAIELNHFPIVYEYRPVDQFSPTECTVHYFNITTPDSSPPEPFTPSELPQIRFETNQVLNDFAPDMNSYTLIENLQIPLGIQIRITCDIPVDPSIAKPPIPDHAGLVTISTDYNYAHVPSPFTINLSPTGSWKQLAPLQQPSTILAAGFVVLSPTPINSEDDFEQLLASTLHILEHATYYPKDASTPSESLLKGCLTRKSFHHILHSGYSNNNIPQSYAANPYYPLSFAENGWEQQHSHPYSAATTTTTSIPEIEPPPINPINNWKHSFSTSTLSVHPNGAYLEFALDVEHCPVADVPKKDINNVLKSHTFFSHNGIMVRYSQELKGLYSEYESPILRYQGKGKRKKNGKNPRDITNTTTNNINGGDDDDDDDIILPTGLKGNGMQCRSHYDCVPNTAESRWNTYFTCYRGYCTSLAQDMTPFEWRLFNAWYEHKYSKHLLSIDTTHDYIPSSTQSTSLSKIVLFSVLGVLLLIGLAWLMYEMIQHYKLCRNWQSTQPQWKDNLIDSINNDGEDGDNVVVNGTIH